MSKLTVARLFRMCHGSGNDLCVCVRARARTRCGVFSVAHLNYYYPCKPRAESSGGSEPSETVCLPCTRAGRAGCAAFVSVAETVHGRSIEGLSEGGAQNRGVDDAARWLSIVCEAIAWCGVVCVVWTHCCWSCCGTHVAAVPGMHAPLPQSPRLLCEHVLHDRTNVLAAAPGYGASQRRPTACTMNHSLRTSHLDPPF